MTALLPNECMKDFIVISGKGLAGSGGRGHSGHIPEDFTSAFIRARAMTTMCVGALQVIKTGYH